MVGAGRGGGRRARGFRDFGFILSGVHLSFLGERAFCGRSGGRGFKLWTSGTGRTGGVCGWVIVAVVGAVGRGGGAAAGNRTEVALFRAGGIGASVFRLLVMESADGTDRVVVLADWSGVPISLAVTAAGGLVGGVGDFDFPFTGEEEDVRAHPLSFLTGGGDHY